MTEEEQLEIKEEILPVGAKDDYVPDCLFETDNFLEIPMLRLDMQANHCDLPFVAFGEQKRTFQMNGSGTLHFYVDDYRFQRIYDHPEQILHHNPRNIVEPNYSLFNETPIAFGMKAVYQKRMIARSMQEKGIRVFVDLNVASKFYTLNMLGVPRGWSSFCTRGYSDRLNYLSFEVEIARSWAEGNPLVFVVYGGGNEVKRYCQQNGLIYATPVITMKNKAKSIEKIKETIAFFGQKIDPTELMPQLKLLPTYEQIREKQIENYKDCNLLESKAC